MHGQRLRLFQLEAVSIMPKTHGGWGWGAGTGEQDRRGHWAGPYVGDTTGDMLLWVWGEGLAQWTFWAC